MEGYSALLVSGLIFSFVAIMHFLRLVFRTNVIIGGKTIPLWASVIGMIVPLVMAIWIFSTI